MVKIVTLVCADHKAGCGVDCSALMLVCTARLGIRDVCESPRFRSVAHATFLTLPYSYQAGTLNPHTSNSFGLRRIG